MELPTTKVNPWDVDTLDVYLHYCCPECDHKSKTKLLFVNHAFSCHPDAKDTLKFAEVPEEIVIKSDIHIKQEVLEPLYNDYQYGGDYVDHHYVGEENFNWFHEASEQPIDSEKPLKKKRKRKKEPKIKSEGNIFDDESTLTDVAPKKKRIRRTKKEMVEIKRLKKLKEQSERIEGPVQCYRCGEIFESMELVKEHQTEKYKVFRKSAYGKERPIQCHVCKYMFESEEKKSYHMCRIYNEEDHKRGKNHCAICDESFHSIDYLMSHNAKYHITELNFACDQCDYKAKFEVNLTRHKKRIHEKLKTEVCHVCGKSYLDKYNLKKHVELAHPDGEQKFVCDKCGASYAALQTLRLHTREKHPVYYLCTFCDLKFREQAKLRIHLLNDHDVKCGIKDIYICWKCKKSCTSFKELDDHLSDEHGMEKHQHRCQLCQDKAFSSIVTLKMHVLKSHEINFSKVVSDPFILKLFDIVTEPNMNFHEASGIPCPLCPKKFSSGRTLSDHHKQVHDKTNHIPCPHTPCQFTSFQPYVLKQHILKKHTKTVKYECDECSFSTYSGHKSVRMHKKKMHNVGKDLRPFQCSECEKNYKSKGNLADHLFEVHNIVYQYETNQGIKSSHL